MMVLIGYTFAYCFYMTNLQLADFARAVFTGRSSLFNFFLFLKQ